jgi:hypothetical protein
LCPFKVDSASSRVRSINGAQQLIGEISKKTHSPDRKMPIMIDSLQPLAKLPVRDAQSSKPLHRARITG